GRGRHLDSARARRPGRRPWRHDRGVRHRLPDPAGADPARPGGVHPAVGRCPVSVRAPLIAGTALSLAVVSAWSWSAALTVGPAAPLHLSRGLLSDYAQLAAAPTGNAWELFAALAVIYALCLLVSGWRHRRGGA